MGIFNLGAIVFDQLVIQQENNIRNLEYELNEITNEIEDRQFAFKISNEIKSKLYFDTKFLSENISLVNSRLLDMEKLKNDIKDLKKNSVTFYSKDKDFFSDKMFNNYKKLFSSIIKQFDQLRNDISLMSNELLEFEKDKTVRDKLLNDIKFSKRSDYDDDYIFDASGFGFYEIIIEAQLDINDYLAKYFILNKYSNNLNNLINLTIYDLNNLTEKISNLKNKKNFLILLSILSQIVGLTFLILLFRNIIIENIKI